jgi:NADPH-dependent 2,4-dienoyl-CoA reductase/sulfur reductase-like enzyme
VTDVFGESRVAGVALSDGSRIDADLVVVGIGVTPNTEWPEGSGLTLDNDIVCTGSGEAAPDVYAAGDVARVANRWHGDRVVACLAVNQPRARDSRTRTRRSGPLDSVWPSCPPWSRHLNTTARLPLRVPSTTLVGYAPNLAT